MLDIPGGDPSGETAAVSFDTQQGPRILVVHPRADGVLLWRLVDPDNPFFSYWSAVGSPWPAGVTARQASLAVVSDGAAKRAAIVFRSAGPVGKDRAYYGTLDDTAWFSPVEPLAAGGAPLDNVLATPGLAQAVDGYEYVAVMEPGATPADLRRICFYRRLGGSAGELSKLDPPGCIQHAWPVGVLPESERTRVNLVFLPYLHGGGVPFADGSGYLAVFWNHLEADDWKRAYTTGFIGPNGAVFDDQPVKWRGQATIHLPGTESFSKVSNVAAGHSLGVTRFGNDVAVYVTPVETFSPPEGSPPIPDRLREPMLIPYANNLAPFSLDYKGEMIDHDDAAVIAATMCTGLWSIACTQKCADPSFACELAAFALMEENVLCDELPAP